MYEKLIVMRAKKKQKDILHVTYAGQGEFYLLNVIRTYICLSFLYSHLFMIIQLRLNNYIFRLSQSSCHGKPMKKKCIRHMSKNVPQGPSIQLSIGIIIVTAQGYTGTETQA